MRISDGSSDVCSSDLLPLSSITRASAYARARHRKAAERARADRAGKRIAVDRRFAIERHRHRHRHVHLPGELIAVDRPVGDVGRSEAARIAAGERSEERSVGKECVSPCRSRWSPYINKKKIKKR